MEYWKTILVFIAALVQCSYGVIVANNDTETTSVNTPICIDVLQNDETDPSTVITASTNVSGWTFINYDPFFLANVGCWKTN